MDYFRLNNFDCRKSPGYLIRRLHNIVVPRAEALFQDAEITFSHWVMLMALRDGLAATAAELARHMNHDTGAITRLLDQLEKRKLITRVRDSDDRRIINLSLTSEGRAMAAALTPRIIDFWNNVLDDFSKSDISTWLSLMARVVAALETTPVQPAARRRRTAR